MTRPRAHLVDPNNRALYHTISRCVRRAWLCGEDPLTGRSYEHRRQWIEDRILYLAQRFSVAIHGYSVMSNHYHVVVELDPQAPKSWTEMEVATRWLDLYPPKRWLADDETISPIDHSPEINALVDDPDRLQVCRQRLGSLSWFMRLINEPLARLSNREDACTGRFWEGRFKSNALLDEAAWLAATVYVDLNPFRAGIAPIPEQGAHTSIRRRIHDLSPNDLAELSQPNELQPVASGFNTPWSLPISLNSYRELLVQTAFRERASSANSLLRPIGLEQNDWWAIVDAMKQRDRNVFGRVDSLLQYLQQVGQRWLRGMRSPLLASTAR